MAVTGRLTKKSFTPAQAGSVKLIYRFTKPSKTFRYRLTVQRGKKWQLVKRLSKTKKSGRFKGRNRMSVTKLFGGEPLEVGSYRLDLEVDSGKRRLSFSVQGRPFNIVPPTVSGTVRQGRSIAATSGTWAGSPRPTFSYQWLRCEGDWLSTCVEIPTATGRSYTLGAADTAYTVRVEVTARNKFGAFDEISDESGWVTTYASSVVAGSSHTCALLADSTVRCWGDGLGGQTGVTSGIWKPGRIAGVGGAGTLADVVSLNGGVDHNCAILENETAACWGLNMEGQLGDGTLDQRLPPVQVVGIGGSGVLSGVRAISAGEGHTCALLSGGRVRCWGRNSIGQLGDGTTVASATPVPVLAADGASELTGVRAIAAGSNHTCAVLLDGSVWCWGSNYFGELGTGGLESSAYLPVAVENTANATLISAGGSFTCALLSNQTIKCWGSNSHGELGDGIADHHNSNWFGDFSPHPVYVAGISNSADVSLGAQHACTLLATGLVKCWGNGENGQLGNGTRDSSGAPVWVRGVDGVGSLGSVTSIGAGAFHNCARDAGGGVKCWGANSSNQLGADSMGDKSVFPLDVVVDITGL